MVGICKTWKMREGFTIWSVDLNAVVLLAGAAGSIATVVFMYRSYRLSQRRPLVRQVLQDMLLSTIRKINGNIEKLEKGKKIAESLENQYGVNSLDARYDTIK